MRAWSYLTFSLGIMLCFLFPRAESAAGEVQEAPTFESPAILEAFIQRKCSFALGNDYHRFWPDHRYSGTGFGGRRMRGTWQLDGSDLVVSAVGEGGPCDESSLEPCDSEWSASFIWRDLRTNGTRLLEVGKTERGGVVYLCEPGRGCETRIGTQCFPVEAVQVRRGSWDRRLYWRLMRSFRKAGLAGSVVVEGPRAVDPREVTEVWFRPDSADLADQVAREIEPIVGPVGPREWAWGGAYRVTIIVGRKRATTLPKRRHETVIY